MKLPISADRTPDVLLSEIEDDTDNVRRELKNSFFSLIKEKMQNNAYHEIPQDPKIMLHEMKKHHESIAEKEKILKEKSLLDSKLAEKITMLELLEEGWYLLRKEIETKQTLLVQKEKMIDIMTLELKNLMQESNVFDKNFSKSAEISPLKKANITQNIPEHQWFMLKNGKKLSSLTELKESLKHIDDETYFHHVNEYKNDFSSWIRQVFMDATLADKIINARSRNELISVLENWKEN